MNKKLICGFVISGISLSPDTDEKEACVIAASELRRAGIDTSKIRFSVYKRSVDARKKKDIKLVYQELSKISYPLSKELKELKKSVIESYYFK